MRSIRRCSRILILCLLTVSVIVPIFVLSYRLKHIHSDASRGFVEDLSIIKHRTEAQTLSAIQQEEGEGLREPPQFVYKDGNLKSAVSFSSSGNYRFGGVENVVDDLDDKRVGKSENVVDGAKFLERNETEAKGKNQKLQQEDKLSMPDEKREMTQPQKVPRDQNARPVSRRALDEKVKQMKDQVIRAKAYLNFAPASSNSHLIKELKLRIKEVERAVGQSTRDSDLSRSALQRMKAMEATLLKANHLYPDCSAMTKKLRAMTYNAEEQLRAHRTQATFLAQLGGRTIPKGLHCLSMKLTAEYFALAAEEREISKRKLHNPDLYHFAVFSDNVMASAVVVNSTVYNSREPERIVFHIVTDSLNLPAMSMWFLLNPPGNATIDIQSIDSFGWLSTKYNAKLQKEESIDPRYNSPLNHLRFYLPDVFPLLDKIVLLDHDVVVQRDLTGLWSIDMRGRVNGAVETCKEEEPSFRRMDMFVNFTDPLLASDFNASSCTWAFGMNVFDLEEWRRKNITWVYQEYLHLGSERPLWKAGSLPIGWITFYGQTVALDRRWQILGLGYKSGVKIEDVERAAVIHFDGISKPWLDIGLEKYRQYWRKYVPYDRPYLQQCNIHP